MTRQEAIEILESVSFFAPSYIDVDTAIDMAIEALEQPTADVVEVVRCKDCVHCADDWNGNQPMFTCDISMCHESVEPSGYCFCGERREDAT